MAARLLFAALLLLMVGINTMALAVEEDFYTCLPGSSPALEVRW